MQMQGLKSLANKQAAGPSVAQVGRGKLNVQARASGAAKAAQLASTVGGLKNGGTSALTELVKPVLDQDITIEDLKMTRNVKSTSYVSRRRMDAEDFDPNAVDSDGLPLVYNEGRIASYWGSRPGELLGRWTRFTAISAPWLTKLANAALSGKLGDATKQAELARDAVNNLESLGPTFIKLGQIMSIRPDVLPPAVMGELAKLQDKITPFSCEEAKRMVAEELGRPIDEIFSEWGEKPVAAASLAQVYRARLRATGEEVAVKVQRPGALATISKDLYVLRRAVGVYEQIIRRFTAQTTDYQQLLSTFAEGLYTEMDFRNEALNAQRMRQLLDASEFGRGTDIVIPQPNMDYTTRRVMTMQWVTGVKLTTLEAPEVRQLVGVGQAAFLTQLLEVGFFHGDPHPGNLLKVTEGPDAGKLALLDFGLVAEIPSEDREAMVSATIHLANRDWDGLIDDFIALGFLPGGCDRGVIIPVMERVLSPYLRGGGAKAFNFQALSQDLLSATLEIPFSVPPYMSLLARSVVTLEGIALVGDPGYQMVAQAYPFVVRKVLRNDSSGSAALLRDILYDGDGKVKPTRLSALLNAGLGYVADAKATSGFIDFDAVPDDGASVAEVVSFLLSDEARELRPLLVSQLTTGCDLLLRDRLRRAYALLPTLAPRLPFVGALLPPPPPPPIFLPGLGLVSADKALELLAPPLNRNEEVYLASLTELIAGLMGVPASDLDTPDITRLLRLATSPSEQVRELSEALATISGSTANASVIRDMAVEVVEQLATKQGERAGMGADTLFGPGLALARRTVSRLDRALAVVGRSVSASSASQRGGSSTASSSGTSMSSTDEAGTTRSSRSRSASAPAPAAAHTVGNGVHAVNGAAKGHVMSDSSMSHSSDEESASPAVTATGKKEKVLA